ncbi:hypothetical protein DERF_003268 [Dermatophagoides farinae]|uniref:Transmembrane protein n=1 Tax=Dermatophagoides farinae TaxID=6954 RepID=A0A922ID83_DERFA|nr:hypothetical protein DERF_003268 [Dermatophagoides farinae]
MNWSGPSHRYNNIVLYDDDESDHYERIVFTDPNGYVVAFLSLIAIHFYFNPIWFKNLNFIFHSHHYSDDDDDKMPTMKSNLHLMIIM